MTLSCSLSLPRVQSGPPKTKLPHLYQKVQVFDHLSMSVAHYGLHSPMRVFTETTTQGCS
jgi:hypothetical protein